MTTKIQQLLRVCLLWCGGTIGMIERDGQRCPPGRPLDLLKFVPRLRRRFDIEVVHVRDIDSSNMSPDDWKLIANALRQRLYSGYAGFVLTHGTDTLAYSASAVALALGGNLHLPVIFTCAQYIPGAPCGDAEMNLIRAHYLCAEDIAEVVISCDSRIVRGCRADKVDEKSFRAFGSPGFHEIGRFDGSGIHLDASVRRRPERVQEVEFHPEFTSGILSLDLRPGGVAPDMLRREIESPACKGIFLASYGAGNVVTQGPFALVKEIEYATKLGKPVVLASQISGHPTKESNYETSKTAVRAGAIPIGNMTTPCAYVKLSWALARAEQQCLSPEQRIAFVRHEMETLYVGEMDIEQESVSRPIPASHLQPEEGSRLALNSMPLGRVS